MRAEETQEIGQEDLHELMESTRLEDVAPTREEQAKAKAAADRFVEHALQGKGPDPDHAVGERDADARWRGACQRQST